MIPLMIIVKALFASLGSLGFAVLFNVPRRVLFPIILISFVGGILKFVALDYDLGLVWSSLFSGMLIGTLSVPFARAKHAPPLVIAIPGVIPMVPGAYIYRTILGMIDIATATAGTEINPVIVTETIHNGIFSLFIVVAISVGAGIPTIITRRQIMTAIEDPDNKYIEYE